VREAVCEAWCDIEEVQFDAKAETLELPFEQAVWRERALERRGWLLSTWTYPVKMWVLRIRHVTSHKVHDEAQIRRVELGTVEYDESAHQVKILSEFPVVITARVRELEIEVEETDTVLQRKRIRLLNWK